MAQKKPLQSNGIFTITSTFNLFIYIYKCMRAFYQNSKILRYKRAMIIT